MKKKNFEDNIPLKFYPEVTRPAKERKTMLENISLKKKEQKKRIPKVFTFRILCRSHSESHPTSKKKVKRNISNVSSKKNKDKELRS